MDDPVITYERFEDTPLAGEIMSMGYVIGGEQPVFIEDQEHKFKASAYLTCEGYWLLYCPTKEDERTHIAKEWDEVEKFFRSRL
jgi:hypothetical protein